MVKIMKIGAYSPYLLKHFGGGEKHFLTSLWYLSQKNKVEALISPETSPELLSKAIEKYQRLFNLDLSGVRWVKAALAASGGQRRLLSPLQNYLETSKYDAFLYLTDGSLFFSGAKKNILHIQFPFTQSGGKLFNLKLKNWQIKNANSKFTRQVVEKAWRTKIPYLHYPYVDLSPNQTKEELNTLFSNKKPIILSSGRFINHQTSSAHSKRQDILIEAFRIGQNRYKWPNLRLILVGSIEPGKSHQEYVKSLKKQAAGLPVEFAHDISNSELVKLYQQSSVFWHAAGYQVDELAFPHRAEHFGMSVIEAMGQGSIPIVVKKGGLKEIITDQENGFLINSIDELVNQTNEVISLDLPKQNRLRQAAFNRASDFSLDKFCQTLEEMLQAAI